MRFNIEGDVINCRLSPREVRKYGSAIIKEKNIINDHGMDFKPDGSKDYAITINGADIELQTLVTFNPQIGHTIEARANGVHIRVDKVSEVSKYDIFRCIFENGHEILSTKTVELLEG